MDFLKKIVKSSIEATTRMSDDTPVLDFGLVPGKRLGLPGSPVSVDYDPAQKLLLVSLHNGDLFLSNADTQIILPKPKDASLHSVKSSILTCIIGTPFVWVRDEHTLRIWDLIRKTSTQIQTINASDITAVQSLPGSGIVFVGFKSGSVLSLDASNGVESSVIEPLEQSQVIGLAPCPVDASLLLISYDTTVHLYDTKECKSVKTFTVDSFNGLQPGSIAWRPDGHHVCVTFNDTLAVWSVKENWLVKKQKPVAVRSLAAPLSKSHPDLVASGNGPITKTVWLPGPTNGQNDSWIVCAGGSKEPGITVLHFDAHPKDYKSPSHSSFFPTTSKLETVVYHDGALLFLLLSDTQGVEAKLFRETWIDIELPSCAAFAARAPKSTLKVFGNGNDVTLLDMCESSKEERKMGRQKPSLPLALNPYHAKDLVRSWDIMCLNFGKGELELWDVSGQRRLFTVNVDSYFTHTPIEHIHLDLADRTLVILGGPHLVLYRFFTTTDIQRVKNEQKEFESMIAGLDEVVESALKEADFVTGILKAKTGGADFEESEAVVVDSPHEQPVDSPLKSPVQSATTELPSPTSVISNDGWLTEFPSSEMQSSGWGLSVHLAHTSALLTVVTDVRHDLMVLVSDSLCLDVTRLSSCQLLKRCSLEEPLVLGTLAHPKIVKFVRTHFVNGKLFSVKL